VSGHNHYASCTCGWCLKRRGGQSGVLYAGGGTRAAFRTFESFTIPNAACPVCGSSVFFYQSPTGAGGGARAACSHRGPVRGTDARAATVRRVHAAVRRVRPRGALDRRSQRAFLLLAGDDLRSQKVQHGLPILRGEGGAQTRASLEALQLGSHLPSDVHDGSSSIILLEPGDKARRFDQS
jgi:hypothetical protein